MQYALHRCTNYFHICIFTILSGLNIFDAKLKIIFNISALLLAYETNTTQIYIQDAVRKTITLLKDYLKMDSL